MFFHVCKENCRSLVCGLLAGSISSVARIVFTFNHNWSTLQRFTIPGGDLTFKQQEYHHLQIKVHLVLVGQFLIEFIVMVCSSMRLNWAHQFPWPYQQ